MCLKHHKHYCAFSSSCYDDLAFLYLRSCGVPSNQIMNYICSLQITCTPLFYVGSFVQLSARDAVVELLVDVGGLLRKESIITTRAGSF